MPWQLNFILLLCIIEFRRGCAPILANWHRNEKMWNRATSLTANPVCCRIVNQFCMCQWNVRSWRARVKIFVWGRDHENEGHAYTYALTLWHSGHSFRASFLIPSLVLPLIWQVWVCKSPGASPSYGWWVYLVLMLWHNFSQCRYLCYLGQLVLPLIAVCYM